MIWVAYEPHVFQDICEDIKKLGIISSECRVAKCEPIIQNLRALVEKKVIIDTKEASRG